MIWPWVIGIAVAITVAVVVIVVLRRRRSSTPPSVAPPPGLGSRLRSALSGDRVDWAQVEDVLLGADVGVVVTAELITKTRDAVGRGGSDPRTALAAEMRSVLGDRDRSLRLDSQPSVVVVVGVNGSGKTTTVAKLAAMMRGDGLVPLLAAADTFRAAAVEQLQTWGSRLGVDVVAGDMGGDPAAVAFDALTAARARGADVVIVDTAGRLHAKSNLMDELAKVIRVLEREAGGVDEVLLVLDAGTGQNAFAQAEAFVETAGVTGVVLTKLDGSARGGMTLVVEERLGIPVKLVGVGEGVDDLLHFEPESFVERLLEGW